MASPAAAHGSSDPAPVPRIADAADVDEIAELKTAIKKLEAKLEAVEKAGAQWNDPALVGMRAQLTGMRADKAALQEKENLLLKAQQASGAAPALDQLTQQMASLATVVTEQQKMITTQQQVIATVVTEQQKVIKRVFLQPPVEIRSFNSSEHFQAISYRTLGELFLQTYRHFGIDVTRLGDGMRFYWLPALEQGASLQERLDGRRTLRNESDWERFLDDWNEQHNSRLIVLYFVTGELSPSLVQCPLPPSPPRMPLDHAEEKSEPASDHGLNARDSAQCVVCRHSDHVEAAHIVDKSRSELLAGAPDAPPIDDLRNLFQLCPNHHTSFDRYEWTLVEEVRQEGSGFWLRTTPVLERPSAELSAHMQTFIRIRDPCPPAYSFLLKQLGRFPVPCRVCGQLFLATAIWGHYNGQHKEHKAQWKDQPHLLPHITGCACADRGDTVWQLYCHVLAHHRDLLYR